MKPSSLSRREKLLLGLLSSTLIFSASFSYGAVSQTKVDSIMKMITDGGAKFSDIPVSGQTKSERTQYFEKVDAGLGDAVEMLATVRNNIRSLMGLSPAYTADDIVGSILGGVMSGVGGNSSNTGSKTGTGTTGVSVSTGSQKYNDAKLCTNFPSGMRYFIVYREINISAAQSFIQDVMYNTQDILSGTTLRSLSPTATDAQKKSFIDADPTNTFTFKGYGTIDDVLRSNMKGTTANSTYRSGDKAIFIRYIDDYEGERLQCTAPVKSVADSQKPGVFVKKMYQVPVEHRKSEDFGGPFFSFKSNDKYTFSQKCIKTLDELRRINPDTIGPNNPNGYQYSSFKNPWGDCFFNVDNYTSYKSGDFGASDIPDSCKIGSHFLVVPLNNNTASSTAFSLSECVPKEYAYGIPPKSPDCTDTNNPDSTALFDATKLFGGGTAVSGRSPEYMKAYFKKDSGEDLPSPVLSLRYDLRSKSLITPSVDGHSDIPFGYTDAGSGGPGMSQYLVSISPCKGDFTSPEARLIGGKFVNMPVNNGGHTIYTQTPGQFSEYFKLKANVDRFTPPIRMQNGGLWYINIQSRWGCRTWYPNTCGDEKSMVEAAVSIPYHTTGYATSTIPLRRVSSQDWKSFWQLPPGGSLGYSLQVDYEGAWLAGGTGDWYESNPNAKPVGAVTGPEMKCTQVSGQGPYYKVNYYLQTLPEANLQMNDVRTNITGITGSVSFQGYITKSERNAFSQLVETKYATWAQPAENPVKAYSTSSCN